MILPGMAVGAVLGVVEEVRYSLEIVEEVGCPLDVVIEVVSLETILVTVFSTV